MKSVLITGAFGQLGKSCSELLKNNFELILSGTYPSDSGIKLDVIEQKSVKTVLDKKSKLRKLFEKEKNMICIPVYEDTSQTLNFVAKDFFKEKKISISQETINKIPLNIYVG